MRVAVFGAGYAGLTVACRLEEQLPDDIDLVVVDESEQHLVQHELHRLVRQPDLEETITVPLEDILSRATVRQARVTDIDTEANVATLRTDGDSDDTEELPFDFAAVCLGAETAFYGLPGVEEHATPLKRLEDVKEIRRKALTASGGQVVVGGAGLSGIQVAGELAELSAAEGLDLDVTIVEMADRIAPGFDTTFADAIRDELEARDVTVETGATVESADEDAVSLESGQSLPCDVFVWTGGIRGPEALGGERTPADGTLRLDSDTFVVGDAGNITDAEGQATPASAQTAVRQAQVAAKNIVRLVNATRITEEGADESSERLYSYTFDSPGWVVSVGDGAVAQIGPVVLSGEPARAAKAAIGAGHLGSVGAIDRASRLVHEELGWPAIDAVDFPIHLLSKADRYDIGPATDPATPGEYGTPLASLAFSLAEEFTQGTSVDLTEVTRFADRDYPGSPANILERTVADSIEAAISFGTIGLGSADHERDD